MNPASGPTIFGPLVDAGTTSTQGNVLIDLPTVNQNGKIDAFDEVNCDQVALC